MKRRSRTVLGGTLLTALLCLRPLGGRAEPPAGSAPSAAPAPTTSGGPAPSDTPSPPPLRHSGRRLHWDPQFDRMDAPEMVLTGVVAGIALTSYILPPLHTGWTGAIALDEQARSLRAPTLEGQLEARSVSNVGLALLTTYPILVDSLIVAYWYRGSDDVALQMALIDAETFAIVAALQGTANFLSGRQRPYGEECGKTVPGNTVDCETDARYRSFFSGHTSAAFTAASLICAHHEALDLFEGPADALTCATGLVAAATIGTLRIVGDAHYLSDVLVGAAVGTTVGLAVPLLHHYKRAPDNVPRSGFRMTLVPAPTGVQIVGAF